MTAPRYTFCAKRYLTKHLMKHVDMYHSQTPEVTKTRIRQDMTNPNGQVRVLICTTAAGMGVNFAGVENVINFGPPQELDTSQWHQLSNYSALRFATPSGCTRSFLAKLVARFGRSTEKATEK